MQTHKLATIALALTLVAAIGVQVWIHYDKQQQIIAEEKARQEYMAEYEAEQELKLEQEQAEREALIKEIESQPITLPKAETKPTVTIKEEKETSEKQLTEAEDEGTVKIIDQSKDVPKKPELPENAVTDDPEKHPEYKPEDNVIKDEPNKPQGGQTNDKGEIYVPGFGWIKDEGGKSVGEVAHMDEGDWNNKVGIMG